MIERIELRNVEIEAHPDGGTASVNLLYPRSDGHVSQLQISLYEVRAADDIRISYDFERDGWKIEQEEILNDHGAYTGTGDWKEVAFVQAWAREREVEP